MYIPLSRGISHPSPKAVTVHGRRIVFVILASFSASLFFACSSPTDPRTIQSQRNSQEYLFAAEFLYAFFIFPDSLPKDTFGFPSPQALYASVNEPWTRYFTPDSAREFLAFLTTETGGMGVLLDPVADGFLIKDVFPNSPAQRAGLLKGDTIDSINGKPLAGLNIDEFHALAGGNIGDVKTLHILRNGKGLTLTVTLGTYLAPSVFPDSLDSTTAYIYLSIFLEETNMPGGTAEELDSALALTRWAPYTILDLRHNPGGYLDQCYKICGRFVPDKTPVIRTHEWLQDTVRFTISLVDTVEVSSFPGAELSRKFVVLVDDTTASAAEILTSCIMSNRPDIKIIGMRTFGKARGQITYPTPDSGLVKVTYSLFMPVNGAPYDMVGIVPDISVPKDSDALVVAQALIAQGTGAVKRLASGRASRASAIGRINAMRKEYGHAGVMPLAYKKATRM
jgi:carboxyl-terminal processing protease